METRLGAVAYSSDDVSRLTGVAYRTLMRWVEQALVFAVRDPRRRRSPLRWGVQGVSEVYVAGQLSARGMPIEVIRAVLLHLRDQGTNPFQPGYMLWLKQASDIGAVVEIVRSDERALELIRGGQALLPLVPTGIAADVARLSAPAEAPTPVPPGERTTTGFPVPIIRAGAAELGGKLYVVGGKVSYSHWNQAHYNTLFALEAEGGRWTQWASFPAARAAIAAVGCAGRLYAIGGDAQIANHGVLYDMVDVYDPATGCWTAGPRLPYPLRAGAAVVYRGEIWLLGLSNPMPSDSVLILDPAHGQWREGPRLPVPCYDGGAAVIGDSIWYVGEHGAGCVSRVLHYDQAGGWRVAATTLPVPRDSFGLAGDGERVYVVGGGSEWRCLWDRVDVFHPRTGRWSTGPALPGGGRDNHVCAVAGSKLYSIGGGTGSYCEDNRVFRVALPLTAESQWEEMGDGLRSA